MRSAGRALACLLALTLATGTAGRATAASMPSATLRVWLKADALTGLSDGDRVSTWTNAMGLGYDATNNGGGLRPTYITNGVNGLPVLRFDPANTNQFRSESYTHGASDATIVVVTKRNGSPASYHNIVILNPSSYSSAGATFMQIYADASHNLIGNFGVDTLDCAPSPTVGFSSSTFQIVVLRKDSATSGSEFFIDGSSKKTGAGAMSLTGKYYIGAWAGRCMNGDVAEILIYNSALAATDRELVEGLLAWKYGLQGNLPSGHAWKTSDPNASGTPPSIETTTPTNITTTSASLAGYLTATGETPTTVSVFWGTTDGGTDAGAWQHTNTFAAGEWAALSYPSTNVSLPSSNVFYYYRFYASNATAQVWASLTRSFLAGDVVVTLSNATAVRGGTNGILTIQRPATGTNEATRVSYVLSGSGVQGTDYTPVATGTSVLLPAGVVSTNVRIVGLETRSAQAARTVTLSLLPGLYPIGAPDSNTVTIAAWSGVSTPTLAYWRFEGDYDTADYTTGFLDDSSGSGHYILPFEGNHNPASQVILPYVFLGGSFGALFPDPVPQTEAANAKTFWSEIAGWLTAADSADWSQGAFTVEALVSPRFVFDDSNVLAVVSHYTTAGNQRSWLLGIPGDSTALTLYLSANGSAVSAFQGPGPAWQLKQTNDYYVAFSFDKNNPNGVTLYLQDLTAGGPLLSTNFAHTLSGGLINSTASLIINGYSAGGGNGRGPRGLIDEVRITQGVLPSDRLLVSRRATPALLIQIQ